MYEKTIKLLMSIIQNTPPRLPLLEVKDRLKIFSGPPLPKNYTVADLFKILNTSQGISQNSKHQDLPSDVINWASGDSASARTFDQAITDFFQRLFQEIINNCPEILLSEVDLFHGHLISTPNDLLLVFHAKEYPYDLEFAKYKAALKINPSVKQFYSSDDAYKTRNIIWSLKQNHFYQLDTSPGSPFHDLIKSEIYDFAPDLVVKANALQQEYLGDNIADINYFTNFDGKTYLPFITRGPKGQF